MNIPRFFALVLLATEAAAFAWISRHYPIAIAAGFGAVAALVLGHPIRLNRNQSLVAILLAGLLAGTPYWLGLYPPRPTVLPGVGALLFLADLAILAQMGLLFHQPLPEISARFARPAEFLLLGAVALTGAGSVNSNDTGHMVFGLLSTLFVVAAAGFVASLRERPARFTRPALAAQFTLLALAILAGWASSGLVAQYGNDIDRYIASSMSQRVPVSFIGFSRTSSLDSISGMKHLDETVALRIYSDQAPGYLRACAYDTYRNGRWSSMAEEAPIDRVEDESTILRAGSSRTLFQAEAGGTAPEWRMDMWQVPAVANAFFTPSGTQYIAAAAEQVFRDTHGTLRPSTLDVTHPVTLLGSEVSAMPAIETSRETLLNVPESLDARIPELASTLFAETANAREKAAVVERYFHENYTYSLEVSIPRGMDPLNYFLVDKPPASCEFFAAGALTLLRLGGVPSRYVTGFVATEGDPLDGAWLARNKDAHAWVEAFDPLRGWFIVEATPPSGQPLVEERPTWQYLSGFLAQQWRLFRGWLSAYLLGGGLAQVLPYLLPLVLLALLAALFAPALFNRKSAEVRKKRPKLTPELKRLHRLLQSQDRRMRKAGMRRGSTETLHHFAARIEREQPHLAAAAAWYRQYAEIRYGTHQGNPRLLKTLETAH